MGDLIDVELILILFKVNIYGSYVFALLSWKFPSVICISVKYCRNLIQTY